jgi:hypothetical protein
MAAHAPAASTSRKLNVLASLGNSAPAELLRGMRKRPSADSGVGPRSSTLTTPLTSPEDSVPASFDLSQARTQAQAQAQMPMTVMIQQGSTVVNGRRRSARLTSWSGDTRPRSQSFSDSGHVTPLPAPLRTALGDTCSSAGSSVAGKWKGSRQRRRYRLQAASPMSLDSPSATRGAFDTSPKLFL